MTSITFSSKKFAPLFKWSLSINRAVVIIYSVLVLVAGPVLTTYLRQMFQEMYADTDEYKELLFELGTVSMFILTGIALLFTFISAVKTFSYVHSKRSIDMYGALPSDRGTMYIANYTAGVASVFVPYLIGALFTMILVAGSPDALAFCAKSILFTLLMILASYAFTALVAYCCGTVVDTVIISLVLNFVWMCLVLMFFVFRETLIFGASFSNVLQTPIPILFAPYAFGFYDMARLVADTGMSSLGFAVTIIWEIIFTLGVFVAGYFMAKKRKSECAQNGFAAAWLPMVIKVITSVAVGAFAGYLFACFSDNGFANMAVYTFWCILLSAVTFAILHIIFQRGLRGGWLKAAIVYVCATVVSLGIVFGLCYGMGIDKYVPSADKVTSVTWNNADYYTDDFVYPTFTDEEDIDAVVELHEMIVSHMDEIDPKPTYFGYDEDYDNPYSIYYTTYSYELYDYDYDYDVDLSEENSEYESFVDNYPYLLNFNFNFTYTNSLGMTTTREYGWVFASYAALFTEEELARAQELAQQLYSSDECKKCACEYIFDEELQTSVNEGLYGMTVDRYEYTDGEGYATTGYVSVDAADSEFINELCGTLKEDITATDGFVDENMFYTFVYDNNNYATSLLGDEFYVLTVSSYDYIDMSFIIPSSYINTVALMSRSLTFAADSYVSVYSDGEFDAYSLYYSDSYFAELCNYYRYGDYDSLDEIYYYLESTWINIALNGYDTSSDSWYDKYYDEYYSKMNEYVFSVYSSAVLAYGEEQGDYTVDDDGNIIETAIFTLDDVMEQINTIYNYSTSVIEQQLGSVETSDTANVA